MPCRLTKALAIQVLPTPLSMCPKTVALHGPITGQLQHLSHSTEMQGVLLEQ